MTMRRAASLAMAAFLLAPASARAALPVAAENAWVRASPPHATATAAYLTLTATADDRLIGVTTPAAAAASLHESRSEGGVARMRPLDGLDLPAGRRVALSPAGYHIMLTGLRAPLRPGQEVTLRLVFRHAAPLEVPARVMPLGRAPASAMPGHEHMPGMDP